MEYSGFGKKSGPSSSTNPNSQFFGNVSPPPQNPSSSIQRLPRPFVQSPPSFGGVQRPLGYNGAQSQWQRPSYPSSSPSSMASPIVPTPSSVKSVSIKVSRPQQYSSRSLNQPVPMRSNVSAGGFRPPAGGVLPIHQSVPPRTHSPEFVFGGNNRTVEGFRPARQLVRPRTNAPEQAQTSNQFVDGHVARPRIISPELASRNNNQFFDLDSFPTLARHAARPRTNSPELAPRSRQFVDLDSFSNPGGPGPVRHTAPPQRTRTPELTFNTNNPVEGFRSSGGVAPPRPVPFPHLSDGQARSPVSYANLEDIQDQPIVFPSYDSERSQFNNSRRTNQARSPDGFQFDANSRFPQNNSKRPSFTHSPELDTTSTSNFSTHDSHSPQRSLPRSSNKVTETAATNPTSFPVMKRSRSPPRNLLSSNKSTTNDSFNDIQDDEREMLAKAKRLARFKVELVENVERSNDDTELKVSTNLHEPSTAGMNKIVPDHSTELNEDFSNELEDSRPPGVILGVCTDMCPASERAERERKGDLDRFERLDGDRNQTSKNLAVKKYTRTAEREANLIRPMATLQKTMEYLLSLLDQPYDEGFLALYNFLWDRMRAIRMDLRMQHIFNQDAITMLEQMIRLHIIVMHELCEYSKGEGFSEGFDAHLNIEQMNKTSVELFQMYDDHRKKGLLVSTEKEFRGYYALLKLDKHPGYMVEPGELSLDLAKMTPEIRQTNEVLFARDVARACRTGNFIAFFRLARKASYLQACLMHAHFAKLRTQALASLHAGLQNNQGLPIIHVAKWLAMEEEDMESLLEYHGFAIKVFDEPYMVKDGAFLNGDMDYNTRCSKLVDMKKSESIAEDVAPSINVTSPAKLYQNTRQSPVRKIPPIKAPKEIIMAKKFDQEIKAFPSGNKKKPVHDVSSIEVSGPVYEDDEDMADYEANQSPKDSKVMPPITEIPVPSQQFVGFNNLSWSFSLPKPLPNKVGEDWRPNIDTPVSSFSQRNMHVSSEAIPSQFISKPVVQDNLLDYPPNFLPEKPTPQEMVVEVEDEEPLIFVEGSENEDVAVDYLDEEIAEAKLKLILRSWKRRASKKRELREQRQFAANAALNSLPLGPLVQVKRELPSMLGQFDINNALRERYKNREQSWSRLNVSEEATGTLSTKNPDTKCLCWKIIVDSQVNYPKEAETGQMSSWLLLKLMPSKNDGDDDLLISYPGLSIWRKWSFGQSYTDQTCCLSVVKEVNFNSPTESVSGASAILFLLRDTIPWMLQKDNLQRLIASIPSGSSLPLLILSSSFKFEASTVINELGLLGIDKSRISNFNFISLSENPQMEYSDGFFSDNRLREGLQWLASESPPQLALRSVKTRELILTHLSPSLESLEELSDTELNPNDCVQIFNEALDRSLANIDSAAKANRNSWPCPEISLLEESSSEHRFFKGFIPEIGWSSVDRISPLLSTLQNIKLPIFKDDFSFLSKGSDTREEIEMQRLEFGKSLVKYLNDSTHLMGFSLAIKEAGTMLQSCRLELRGSLFYIVPDWAIIFRRIFNWRLMRLSSEALSSAYILECPDTNPLLVDDSRLEDDRLLPHHLNSPTLDEMIEVSFRPVGISNNQAFQQVACSASNLMEVDREFTEVVSTGNGVITEFGASEKVNKEADRLSELLEKCNILQNMIDDKLSVYF